MSSLLILSPLSDNMDSLFVTTVLSALGLSAPEIAVYTELLAIGAQPASVTAKKAKLKRGHTYNVLGELTHKGLVQEFTKSGVRYFTAAPPQTLLSILANRQDELDLRRRELLTVIPDLERVKNPLSVRPKVRFFQGIDGIKEIYEETISVPDQILYAVGDFEHFFPKKTSRELNAWVWKYCERRAKKGIWYYGILNRSETSDEAYRTRVKQKRKLKMLVGVDLSVEVNVIGDKVAIVSSSKDMVGLIIEDRPTAETLRNFHRAVWAVLPDYVPSSSTKMV